MTTPATTSQSLLLARLFWMMAGPAILLLTSIQIVMTGRGWLTLADLVFGATIAGMIIARWADGRGADPRRADGEPARPGDLRRYGIGLVGSGLALWVLVNL